MSNISLIFQKIKNQTFKNLKIVVFNNGKEDLSFKYCEMVKRKNLALDIDLVDCQMDLNEIATHLLDRNYSNILLLNGLFDQLDNVDYLNDVANSIEYENGMCIKFANGEQIKSRFFEQNAFYENASTMLTIIENDDELNQQDILVSVVIASYNYEELIGQAIESVLAQTYKNIEVIVVDDGSTDRSVDVVKQYIDNNSNIKLIMHPDKKNHGLNESLKLAIVKSKGEYIAFCEADDILHPDNIAKKIRLVKQYENMPLIIANDIQTFGERRRAAYLQKVVDQRMAILRNECNAIDDDIILHNNLIATFSSVMLKRSALLRCSFQPSFVCCTDWWLYSQILKEDNHIYVVHEKLTSWRAHKSFAMQSMNNIKNNKDSLDNRQAYDFLNKLSIVKHIIKHNDSVDEKLTCTKQKINSKNEKVPNQDGIAFSIIMPTYNRANCICNAIDSALAQTYQNFELIIVDDGSTDDTIELLHKKYNAHIANGKIKIFEEQHNGVSYARNVALSHAKNEWITYLDSDDVLNKNYLQYIKINILDKPQYSIFILDNDIIRSRMINDFSYEELKKENYIQIESFIHKKHIYDELGGFDCSLKRLTDWDVELRYLQKYHAKIIKSSFNFFTVDTNQKNRITQNANCDINYIRNRYDSSIISNLNYSANHTYFIKIIIPCWGIENEIGRMLDSIVSQTFTDYHIVCVEDHSPDNTFNVLLKYYNKFPNKITIIKNDRNYGAGQSRNIGYNRTLQLIPSKYIWIVDGDDYLADKYVLDKIYNFAQNKDYDLINIGWTNGSKYQIAKLGWPVGFPGRIIKQDIYVPGLTKNIAYGNDVYSHFIMFDNINQNKIGELDYNCYVYPKPGKHHNHTDKTIDIPYEIGNALMTHTFKHKCVVENILTGKHRTGAWIKNHMKNFNLKLNDGRKRKISIVMASFPFRKAWMLRCIKQLIDQCDNFYLWLNEYDKIPDELNEFDKTKLHIILSTINLKENGRYMFLNNQCRDDYCFICDDDIDYPSNYVQNTLQCFERNGNYIIAAYYIHSSLKFKSEYSQDSIENIKINTVVPHYRFGAGTMAFIPSIIDFKFTYEELESNYDIEMFFGQQCIDRNINVITPQRPKNFIKFIRDVDVEAADIDKCALHLNGSQQRIQYTYDYMSTNKMI